MMSFWPTAAEIFNARLGKAKMLLSTVLYWQGDCLDDLKGFFLSCNVYEVN